MCGFSFVTLYAIFGSEKKCHQANIHNFLEAIKLTLFEAIMHSFIYISI